jgi:hypothetical protein
VRDNGAGPSLEYEAELRNILGARDWEGLREFSRARNAIDDDAYAQPQHFWEVLLHKLTCNRFDLAQLHAESRAWLLERGYSTDLGGY